ncbi:hypothetical protein BpHYR1_044702 [Brachionus plicatilis]|uniref:Uncharacterized protein n=1 Tax=Brachionus plicatilis TaxID=10195 RepID=A0A3M7PL78_BRAPC|nr:hypothetical protein BpHYR1_044702 [Brachionus plicatilis]
MFSYSNWFVLQQNNCGAIIGIPCWGTRALIPKVICEVHAQTLTPSMFDAQHVQLWSNTFI